MRGLVFICLLILAARLGGVEIGTPRVNVLQELGRPMAAVKRGDTELLTYKDGVKVRLQAGRVVEVTGLKPAAAVAPPAEPAAPEEKPEPAEPPLTKEQAAELAKAEKAAAEADAKARLEMERALAALENPAPPAALGPAPFALGPFLLELVLKALLTLAALALACKYWNSDVPLTGLLLVAGVDTAVRGVIGYLGHEVLGMMTLFYADEAVAALVMVGLLRKVSINQRLALAIEVVVTTKTFSIVVGSFLVTVALRMLA